MRAFIFKTSYESECVKLNLISEKVCPNRRSDIPLT